MKSMAVRGTIIILAAVALIGAVVALRVAQAQTPAHLHDFGDAGQGSGATAPTNL